MGTRWPEPGVEGVGGGPECGQRKESSPYLVTFFFAEVGSNSDFLLTAVYLGTDWP